MVPARTSRRLQRTFELVAYVLFSALAGPLERWDLLAGILLIRAVVDLALELHWRFRVGRRQQVVLTVEAEVVETSPGIFETSRELVLPEGVRFWQR